MSGIGIYIYIERYIYIYIDIHDIDTHKEDTYIEGARRVIEIVPDPDEWGIVLGRAVSRIHSEGLHSVPPIATYSQGTANG